MNFLVSLLNGIIHNYFHSETSTGYKPISLLLVFSWSIAFILGLIILINDIKTNHLLITPTNKLEIIFK